MVEKGTKPPKPNTSPQAETPHHLAVFPLHWVKHVKRKLVAKNGPEFSKKRTAAQAVFMESSPVFTSLHAFMALRVTLQVASFLVVFGCLLGFVCLGARLCFFLSLLGRNLAGSSIFTRLR